MAEAVTGMTCGVERRPVYGRAEPAPPRGGRGRHRWPKGEIPAVNAKGGFL